MSGTITMQGFRLAAISDVEKTKLRRKCRRMDGRTEIWTPISHPAISRCDKKISLKCQRRNFVRQIKAWVGRQLQKKKKKKIGFLNTYMILLSKDQTVEPVGGVEEDLQSEGPSCWEHLQHTCLERVNNVFQKRYNVRTVAD